MESLRDWLRPGEARAKFPGMGNSERAAKGYGSERSISSRESIGISRKRSRPWKTAIAVALLSAAMVVPSQQASAVSLPTMTKHWDVVKSLEMSHQANRELLETLRSEVKSFRQGVESLKQLAQAPSFVDLPPSSFSYPPTPANEAADTAAQSTEDNFGGPSESWMHVYDMPSEHGDSNGPRQRTEYHYNDDKHKQDDSDLSTVTPAGEEAYDPFERPFTHMSAISRNDGPLELTGITRHGSMEDIVMMDQNVKPVDELVCFLDLDKCSIYGQDGNDLAIACQWMQRPEQSLVELYRRLLNPCVKQLYAQLQMSVEKMPVVLYTMRPQLLRYRSACRASHLALRWKTEWHHSMDQVMIPPHVTRPEEILDEYSGSAALMDQEKTDLYMSWQRLLAIRQVIKEELNLDEVPSMVVTSTLKDVQATAKKLGLRPEVSYLWDDNEVMKGQPHVLTVAPYTEMEPEVKEELLSFLERELPAEGLSEDVSDFMLGAKEDGRSLNEDGGRFSYHIRETERVQRFPIPELPVRYSTPAFTAMQPELADVVPCLRKDVKKSDHYCGSVVEYYTAAWRRPDLDQLQAKQQWAERAQMVW
mmetsp:Transcript_54330/g.128170  ORF Transcript_54330/g.128170 Transcript_54330/m.128170 type:complete len:590 (+) Transcript_54330:138-1907(+)